MPRQKIEECQKRAKNFGNRSDSFLNIQRQPRRSVAGIIRISYTCRNVACFGERSSHSVQRLEAQSMFPLAMVLFQLSANKSWSCDIREHLKISCIALHTNIATSIIRSSHLHGQRVQGCQSVVRDILAPSKSRDIARNTRPRNSPQV